MKRVLSVLALCVTCLIGVVLFRTLDFDSKQTKGLVTELPVLDSSALRNLRAAITFPTISHEDSSSFDSAAFLDFQQFLRKSYPKCYERLELTFVQKYTMVFRWPGSVSTVRPVVLMAHQDVVPVEKATENLWTAEPFSGVVKDGYIWGRGTADDKINLIAIMQSVEKLLASGFAPERTIYLVFGHDEEVGGSGAKAVAEWFRDEGIRPALVLDEGGIVTREKVPGLKRTVALIGTSEKGFLTIRLNVEKGGGHSAMPERETAIDVLAAALARLNDTAFEPRFSPSSEAFAEFIGPEMPFMQRMAFANLWLFRPLVFGIYEKSAAGNAMIRTTMVPTIVNGGVKENVVPTHATATLNLRLLPGDSVKHVEARIKEIINDERVHLTRIDSREASTVTSPDSFAYQIVHRTAAETYDSVVATPFLMIAATDSRHFDGVSDGIIKFSPMIDPIGFHGIDERVSLESYRRSLLFFEKLIRNVNTYKLE